MTDLQQGEQENSKRLGDVEAAVNNKISHNDMMLYNKKQKMMIEERIKDEFRAEKEKQKASQSDKKINRKVRRNLSDKETI